MYCYKEGICWVADIALVLRLSSSLVGFFFRMHTTLTLISLGCPYRLGGNVHYRKNALLS